MKRILLAFMIMLMLTATACGSGGQANTGGDSSGTGGSGAGAGNDAVQEAPKADATTIIWYAPGELAEEHNMVMDELNGKLVDRLNLKLDFRLIPFGEYSDKMKLASTSGEAFDLVWTSSWLYFFIDNVAREALYPLDDLIQEYGKELQNSVPSWLFDAGRAAGKLYGIPNYQMVGDYYGLYIQKEYADKYGLDENSIKKFEDLEPFLYQIRDSEPDVIPVLKQQSPKMYPFYEAFLSSKVFIRKDDASLTAVPEWEAMHDEWVYMNNLYKDGLIRKDIATVIDDTTFQQNNMYVATLNIAKPGGEAEATANYGKEYIQIPVSKCYIAYDSGVSTVTAISSTTEHPEDAMRFYNVMYTDEELFNMLLFGLEGVHYTKPAANRVELAEGSKYFYGGQAWAFGNQLLAWYVPGQEDGTWEETERILNNADVSPLRGFYFDPEPVQSELAQIDAVRQEYQNQAYVAADLAAFELDYTTKLKAAGMERVVEEFQSQVDAWAKEMGKK